MITGFLLIAVILFSAVISYRKQKLATKVIKNIPIIDWLFLLGIPISIYISLTIIINNVISRPRVNILDLSDIQFISIGMIFLIYAFVGVSIHFVGKVLWRYLKINHKSKAYQVNEIFHGKLSHYFVFVCCWILVFILCLFEINYPLVYGMNAYHFFGLSFFGIILGLSAKRAIFYTNDWYGGYNKPMFVLTVFLSVVLISVIKWNNISLSKYPLNIFILSGFITVIIAFVTSQAIIIARLSQKRRIKFLMKIMSA